MADPTDDPIDNPIDDPTEAGAASDQTPPTGTRRPRFSRRGPEAPAWPDDQDDDPAGDDDPAADTAPGSGRRSMRVLAVIAGAVLVLIAAVAIVAIRGGNGGGSSAQSPPATQTTLPPVPAGFIDSAALDSDRITDNEFFKDTQVEANGRIYKRLARKLDTGCPNLTGDLTTQLKGTVCRQVVQALYLSTPLAGERPVLTGVTVFVLDTKATAAAAADILNQGRGGITALPIPANSVPNSQITGPGGNNSWRGALPRGHYLIFTQVAYTDGTQGAGTDPPLRNAQTDLSTLATEPIGDRAVLGHGPR